MGKPPTAADGRFVGHDLDGAGIAERILTRLREPQATVEYVTHLVRQHMFSYDRGWSDAAVRRFLRRIGPAAIEDLLALREADNVGSGLAADHGDVGDLRRRCRVQVDARVPLGRADLAIDGRDLMAELGLAPGPRLGAVLEALLERVVGDPRLNDRETLIGIARGITEDR